ncbi:MAG: DUF6876 family protein [Phycisphaerales bacterium JB065]
MSPLTPSDLRRFTGSLERFRHPLNRRVIYTPGVRYLAEQAGAYWLLDIIASYLGSPEMTRAISDDPRLGSLQFWRLDVHPEGGATVLCRADSGEESAIRQDIAFTDFPLDYVDVWVGFDGEHWTLYLPSEH